MGGRGERERQRGREGGREGEGEREREREIEREGGRGEREIFTLGTHLRISKFCVYLCKKKKKKKKKKKSDHTRCLAVSTLEYNINWNSKSAARPKAFWFSEGRTK